MGPEQCTLVEQRVSLSREEEEEEGILTILLLAWSQRCEDLSIDALERKRKRSAGQHRSHPRSLFIAYEYFYRILFIHYWEMFLTRYIDDDDEEEDEDEDKDVDDEQLQYYHWSRNENSQLHQCGNIKETRKFKKPCVASRSMSRARSEKEKRKNASEENPTISKNKITFIWLSPSDRKQWKENEKTSSIIISMIRSWLEIESFPHLYTYPWSVPQHEGMMKSIQTQNDEQRDRVREKRKWTMSQIQKNN